MKNKLFTIHYSLFTLMALLLVSCGYKPSSHVIKNVFADKVYVKVIVDRVEPENAPFVRDEMNRMVYTRFKGRVVSKEEAQSQIHISYAGSTLIPLAYANGYVTRYMVNVRMHFDMLTKDGRITKDITSIVESDIEASSLSSSALRIEALRRGLEKTMDEFLAYVSAKGMLKESK
ncbi:hypothetical protein [Sulfurovum sp.]|uniref:hypothetical protein n=1 Tax=Sulfurovum sp. TaxID=1969726 RepID=UPI0028680E94|nr:hypothetical protein [Sulfurovum sp.]